MRHRVQRTWWKARRGRGEKEREWMTRCSPLWHVHVTRVKRMPSPAIPFPPSLPQWVTPAILFPPPPLGQRRNTRLVTSGRKLWSLDRSLEKSFCLLPGRGYASGWQRVSLLLIVSFFSFFKARLCRIVPAHLAHLKPNRPRATRVCGYDLFLFRNFSSGVAAICQG